MADETKEGQEQARKDPSEASADEHDPDTAEASTTVDADTPSPEQGPEEENESEGPSEPISGLDEGLRAIEDEASRTREAPAADARATDGEAAEPDETDAPPPDEEREGPRAEAEPSAEGYDPRAQPAPASDADALPPLDLPDDFGDLDEALGFGDELGGDASPQPLAPEPLPPAPPAPAAAEEEEAEGEEDAEAAAPGGEEAAPTAPAPERRGPSWPMLVGAAVALSIVVAAVTAVVVRELVAPVPSSAPGAPGVARTGPIEAERFWREGAIARARLVADSSIPPRRFYEIFTDFEHWDEFMPGVTAAAAVEPEIEAPIGTNRVRLKIREHDPVLAREIAAELEFTLDPMSEVVMRTLEHPYGRVREIWRVRRVEGRAGAQIEYERFARATTDLPEFLDRARVRRRFLDVLEAVATRAGGGGAAVAAP